MANKLFTNFKLAMGNGTVTPIAGTGLAITGAAGAGMAVQLSTMAISNANALDTNLEFVDDLYNTNGRPWYNSGTVPTGGNYSKTLWETPNKIFVEKESDTGGPPGTGLTGTFAAVDEYAVHDITTNATFESVDSSGVDIVVVVVSLLGATAVDSDSRLVAKFDS